MTIYVPTVNVNDMPMNKHAKKLYENASLIETKKQTKKRGKKMLFFAFVSNVNSPLGNGCDTNSIFLILQNIVISTKINNFLFLRFTWNEPELFWAGNAACWTTIWTKINQKYILFSIKNRKLGNRAGKTLMNVALNHIVNCVVFDCDELHIVVLIDKKKKEWVR